MNNYYVQLQKLREQRIVSIAALREYSLMVESFRAEHFFTLLTKQHWGG
jgi:hypothetical protein